MKLGGNQYKADPRQADFLVNYLDPKSKTFSNAYASAKKAGYAEEYAKTILARENEWLSEIVSDFALIKKAERNLKELLDEKKDKRIKADMTKFVLERLVKGKYSSRTEVEHKGEIEQKIIDDKGLLNASEVYAEHLKGTIRKEADSSKHAGVDKKRGDSKRKGKAD